MCLAVPGRLQAIVGDEPLTRIGKVAFLGIVKDVSLALLPDAKINDYLLVHAGIAITVLDEAAAQESLAYLQRMGEGP